MKRVLGVSVVLLAAVYLSNYLWSQQGLNVNEGPVTLYVGNCNWTNFIGYGPPLLDLSQYRNVHNITGIIHLPQFNLNLSYIFSPCGDYKICQHEEPAMIGIYTNKSDIANCTDIAYFNSSNYGFPTWSGWGPDQYWKLQYYNYRGNQTRHAKIEWHCDPYLKYGKYRTGPARAMIRNQTVDFNFTFYTSAPSVCYNHSENISTTTTTAIPGGDCLWNIGDNVLNLTQFKDQTIAAVDKNNSAIIDAITPCQNGLTCGHQGVMSYRYNYKTDKCITYLAEWEEGINEPRYNPTRKEWQFVYTNGEKCGGFENIYSVYWLCDYRTNNEAKITYFEQTGTCSYEMRINSSSACP